MVHCVWLDGNIFDTISSWSSRIHYHSVSLQASLCAVMYILDMLLYFRRLWLSCLAHISGGIATSTIFVPICADLLATAKYATGSFFRGEESMYWK